MLFAEQKAELPKSGPSTRLKPAKRLQPAPCISAQKAAHQITPFCAFRPGHPGRVRIYEQTRDAPRAMFLSGKSPVGAGSNPVRVSI